MQLKPHKSSNQYFTVIKPQMLQLRSDAEAAECANKGGCSPVFHMNDEEYCLLYSLFIENIITSAADQPAFSELNILPLIAALILSIENDYEAYSQQERTAFEKLHQQLSMLEAVFASCIF